jgi:CHAT domain-containing protein/Tfp pilus assembly protein PilF
MQRAISISLLVVYLLLPLSASFTAEPDPAMQAAEAVYWEDGAAAALPEFNLLVQRFEESGDQYNEALARHFVGACHRRLGNFDSARQELNRALELRRLIDDEHGIAKTTNLLGLLEWDLGNYDQAIGQFEATGKVGRSMNDPKIEGAALNNLSLVYDELGDYRTSLSQYEQVLAIYADADFPRGEGDTYGNIGGVYLLLGRYRESLENYEKALTISIELESSMAMSQDHGNIGLAHLGLGEIDVAIGHFDQAIELATDAGMRQDVAYWQRAKANAQISKGRFDSGIVLHRKALDTYEDIGARGELLGALHDMGQLHLSLGDPASAESYFEQAISLARDIGNANGIIVNLLALGDLFLHRDQLDAAARYYGQARQRAARLDAQALLADSLLGLAHVHHRQQRFDEVDRETGSALTISRSIESRQREAEALFVLGENKRDNGAPEASLEFFADAESILVETGDVDILWQLYFGRAKALELLGDKRGAINSLEMSVVLIESVRSRLREERFRSGYLQDKQKVYVELVRLQLELDMTEEAFQTAERLRARSYSQQFERMGMPLLNDDLRRQERELRERVRQLQRALGEEQESSFSRQAALQTFSIELIAAEREYQAFLDDHLRPVARRAATTPLPDSTGVQRQLAGDEVLVEYVVGEDAVMAFAITNGGIAATIEPVRRVDLHSRVELLRDLIGRPGDSRWQKPAAALADVLIAPLARSGSLDGVSNIYVVPHGVLNYLPFAVLPAVGQGGDDPLLEHYTLRYLPTAAAIGDSRSGQSDTSSLLAVAPGNSRLRYAPDEARSINALFEPNSRLLLGVAATESRFKSIAGNYELLHLATHSDFNKLNPMFSGLQLEADRHNDGRLEVHEVLRLDLDADLVTLSACDTALGSGYFAEVPAGDEFVGLTRAFLSVGSDTVMATLWEVDDRSSVQLMQEFYERLGGPGATADKSAALMLAQQQLRSTKGYEHPYYWAPFVLVEKMSNASTSRTQVPEATL